MGEIVFTCARTGRAFSSGFEATCEDLQFAPPQWKVRLFCRICYVTHEFDFATAYICDCPDYCHKQRIDCELCKSVCASQSPLSKVFRKERGHPARMA